MAGHSHWHSIKYQKSREDLKRGQIFSKLSRLITVAAREGTDPEFNPKLRQAIEEAKRADMPKQNIEKAIARANSKDQEKELKEVSYEVIGPGGVGLILEGITDNNNRTISEIKQLLKKHNAKLGGEGTVKYLFERKGIILIEGPKDPKKREQLELQAIEVGAENLKWRSFDNEDFLEVITKKDELYEIKQKLEEFGAKIESAVLGWVPKNEIDISEQDQSKLKALLEQLDNHEDIQEIYSNTNL